VAEEGEEVEKTPAPECITDLVVVHATEAAAAETDSTILAEITDLEAKLQAAEHAEDFELCDQLMQQIEELKLTLPA
jgi:hypothetical protein